MMRNDRDPDPNMFAPSMDKWDGAVAARDRLFAAVEEAKLGNVVTLAGDIHQNWAGELKKNFLDEKSATLGVEFVATSISSDGDGFDINDTYQGPAAAAALRQILQQPARLRPPHRDACPLAGRLPGARQGERAGRPHVDAQELRRRKRQERSR